VSFAPGETARTISVTVFGDFVIEPNETFAVNLSGPSGATIADGQGTGTIVNDDTVATTLAALVAQITGCSAGSTSGQCKALLAHLATVQREIAAGHVTLVVRALQQFVALVEVLSRPLPGNGHPPLIDPATAAVWTAEAQSIITALSTT
jgi:hypothetical protein